MKGIALTLAPVLVAWSVASGPAAATGAAVQRLPTRTFKVATWNVRSGMGIQGFGTKGWSHDTLNCTDTDKPLNAWGLGLPQRELRRIAEDAAIVALAVQEAWNCGSPDNLNSVLGFTRATRERNGVALLARHGFAGEYVMQRIGSANYDSWIVGGRVCLDAPCSEAVPIFSTHWGAKEDADWPRQARNVIEFLKPQRGPHVFAGDLNVHRIDRWNPQVPCTAPDSTGRVAAIDSVESAGYTDAWKATQSGEGWTGMTNRRECGAPPGNLYKRIDYIYAKGAAVVSTHRFARPAPGTDAPSDHAGLVAELSVPVSRGR